MEDKAIKYYKISEKELIELLADAAYAYALRAGGVDNWEWEADSCINFLAEVECEDFEEYAENEVACYELLN